MSIEKQKKRVSPTDIDKDHICTLELFNDDYHSFDYVIESLIEICELDSIQAVHILFIIKENVMLKGDQSHICCQCGGHFQNVT